MNCRVASCVAAEQPSRISRPHSGRDWIVGWNLSGTPPALASVLDVKGEEVNRAVLVAVLQVIETWVERDRSALARLNGAAAAPTSVAAAKGQRAYAVLQELLPSHAYRHLEAGLANFAPQTSEPPGVSARRWGSSESRVGLARSLLASAAQAQRAYLEREEAARVAAEQEAARLAAEAERLAAEEASRAAAARAAALQVADRAAALERYRSRVEAVLERDFLAADEWFASWDTSGHVTTADFENWKVLFVQRWVREVLGDDSFDTDQARAVATTASDLRLVARAGSGKTRTVVTRALFLQLHCRVDPAAIVLVAFNRKAVEEMNTRIRSALPRGARPPHVVTFHALAYALLRPDEDLVFDDEDADTLAQSQKVQEVVDSLLLEREDDVRRAMLGFFRNDWDIVVRRGLNLTREEFFESRSEVTHVTLGGEYVKSFGERQIANVLFEHDVDYQYERNFTRGGFNYRPDFTVLVGGKAKVIIEYFGITGEPGYRRLADQKREFWWSQSDVSFVEFQPSQIPALGEAGFRDRILHALDRAGVTYRRLSEDEVWGRARRRAILSFSKTNTNVVNRARQLNWGADDLRTRVSALHEPSESVLAFLQLGADVYEEYLARSKRDGFEDFSGVMWRAAEEVRAGSATWTRAAGQERGDLREVRYIHVDEFQDFSVMFMEFIQAIRRQAPRALLCCVGDDWQAINGFAGADLRFFNAFAQDFPSSTTHGLTTNYRSGRRIVSAGNAVMDGRGEPARPFKSSPGSIQVARLDDFRPEPTERHIFDGDSGTPALLRLINHALTTTNGNVAVLFRRNTVPWYTNHSRNAFGRKLDQYLKYLQRHLGTEDAERLEVTTAHKYKGREAEAVIVADADARSYPLIHPTAELFEIFGDSVDSLIDADRRLFYVATTRAEVSLYYLVTTGVQSPFLGAALAAATAVSWDSLPMAVKWPDDTVEVRVYDGYEIRDVLSRQFGFEFDGISKAWFVFRPAAGFDFEEVRKALAVIGPRLIEVRDGTQNVIHHAGARLV